MVETNIDDMNPEFYDYIMEKLFAVGALDVFFSPIHMKKNRPAVKLNVLTPVSHLSQIMDVIFRESTSIGIRVQEIERYALEREIKEVKTPWGIVRVKLSYNGELLLNAAPEYEDCRKLASQNDIPIKEVYNTVRQHYTVSKKEE